MRHRSAIVLPLGMALLLAACGESEWAPPVGPMQAASPRGVWIGRANEAAVPEVMATTVRPSPKVHIFAGHTLGYELTYTAPSNYRFRWTTDNLVNHTGVRRFTGSVYTPGRFVAFAPGCDDGSCDLEEGDHVSGVLKVASGGERITWDTLAKDGWDGFSFTTDSAPVYFEVDVDGRARPELLELVTWNEPTPVPSPPPAKD